MPYYKETRAKKTQRSDFRNTYGTTTHVLTVDESSRAVTYRSQPHIENLTSEEVLDEKTVDPYAYFLDSITRKQYHALLMERGLKPQGSPDRGHAFEIIKHSLSCTRVADLRFGSNYPTNIWDERYLNSLIMPSGISSQLTHVHPYGPLTTSGFSWPDGLHQFAQSAYAKTAPTAVVFDAAQFLGELREGLPRLILSSLQGRASAFRAVGNEYLNIEFGWKPFVRDLQNAVKALTSATETLSRSGKRVHRSLRAPVENSFDQASYGAQLWVQAGFQGLLTDDEFQKIPSYGNRMPTGNYVPTSRAEGVGTLVKTRTVERWFDGEFTSFLPLRFNPESFLDRASVLINTDLTPLTLWQLAPWTWLIDWFAHLDDTIEANMTAANDLLVMHYGYAMERTSYGTSMSWRYPSIMGPEDPYRWVAGLPARGGSFAALTTRFKRIRANPFGFNVGGEADLSLGQLAILGALGLTRLR